MSDSMRPYGQQPTRLLRPWDRLGKNIGVGCHFLLQCMKVKSQSEVAQSCPTLSDPMDCSLPGSSVHGIFQARALEWGAIAFSWWCTYVCISSICVCGCICNSWVIWWKCFPLVPISYFSIVLFIYEQSLKSILTEITCQWDQIIRFSDITSGDPLQIWTGTSQKRISKCRIHRQRH